MSYDVKSGGDATAKGYQDVDVEGTVKGVSNAENTGFLNKAFGGDVDQDLDQITKTAMNVGAHGGAGGKDNIRSDTNISL